MWLLLLSIQSDNLSFAVTNLRSPEQGQKMAGALSWDVFEVFIASPSDVEAERAAVVQAILEWNDSEGQTLNAILLPRQWEQLSPRQGIDAQDYINRAQVARADFLVAFFGGKVGE